MKTTTLFVTLTLALVSGCGMKVEETPSLKAKTKIDKKAQPQNNSKKTEPPKVILSSAEAKAVVESAIRLEINKPEGDLTKADFERVTVLFLINTQLTNANALAGLTQLDTLLLQKNTDLTDISALAGFAKLTSLTLLDNPNLTKAQIEMLQQALPKCAIKHNAKK